MGWLKDWREDMKKTFVFKSFKSIGRTGAKVVQYGAPPVGAFVFGPLGALVGTGVGAAAGQVGPTKNAGSQLQRDLIYGGAWAAGTTALSLLTSGGFSSSIFKSASSIFGPSAGQVAEASALGNSFLGSGTPGGGTSGLDNAFLSSGSAGGGGGSGGGGGTAGVVTSALNTVATAMGVRAGGGNNAQLQQQYLDQLALAEKMRAAGDTAGALQADATAEAYRQQLIAAGETPGGGGFPWGLILIAGAALYFLTRRKAA